MISTFFNMCLVALKTATLCRRFFPRTPLSWFFKMTYSFAFMRSPLMIQFLILFFVLI